MNNKTIIPLLLFLIVIALNSCRKEEDTIILKPNAGTDLLDIENDGYVVNLNAVSPVGNQKGTWHIYSGENGAFKDINLAKTQFSGEPGEKYTLGWELSEGDKSEVAKINVSFKPLKPAINSIPDTTYNNISLFLNAEEPKFGATGEWTIISGNNGRLIESEKANAIFIGTKHQQYTLQWTLKYGSKRASINVTFNTDELKALPGNNNLDIKTSKNELKFYNLQAFLPAGATGLWTILKGENGKIYTPDNANSLFQGVADTLYTLTWKVMVGEVVSTDTINLRFRGRWGMWTDPADGQNYRITEINGLEWMADNYNLAVKSGEGSLYYGHGSRSVILSGHALETEEERKEYGRLYDWFTATENAPEGWRLPSYNEVYSLLSHLGGELHAVAKIKKGGDTGLELNYAGYYEMSSPADPAYRNVFDQQDKLGEFWLQDYSKVNNKALVFDVALNSESVGTSPLDRNMYAVSVRYVRNGTDKKKAAK